MKLKPQESVTKIFGKTRFSDGYEYKAHIPSPVSDIKIPYGDKAVKMSVKADEALAVLASSDAASVIPDEMLSLIEGVDSSRIEEIVASYPSVAAGLAGGKTDTEVSLVMQNVDALQKIQKYPSDTKMTLDTIGNIHRAIVAHEKFAGVLRDRQVWIGGRGTPISAAYVPPPQEKVLECLEDWVEFMNREDIPLCLHMALGHAQFQCIHPFADGNGRAGRAIYWWQMRRQQIPFLPLASLFISHRRDYYKALQDFQSGNPDTIIKLFAKAVIAACEAIREVTERWKRIDEATISALTHDTFMLKNILRTYGAVTPKGLAEAESISDSTSRKKLNQISADSGFPCNHPVAALKYVNKGQSVYIATQYLRVAYRLKDLIASFAGPPKHLDSVWRVAGWTDLRSAARMTYPTPDSQYEDLAEI